MGPRELGRMHQESNPLGPVVPGTSGWDQTVLVQKGHPTSKLKAKCMENKSDPLGCKSFAGVFWASAGRVETMWPHWGRGWWLGAQST